MRWSTTTIRTGFSRKAGLKAALEARKEGKVRFIGFTGHKDPRIHAKMLAKPHDWDSAQMPVNVMDPHYPQLHERSDSGVPEEECRRDRDEGLGGGHPNGRFLTEVGLTSDECYRFCLSQPVTAQVMGINTMEQLKQDVALARSFKPLSPHETNTLMSRVKDVAGDGRHELFKSTKTFDGPHHRKQHGFAIEAAD